MKKWAALLIVSIVLFGGYSVTPVTSADMLQSTNYSQQDEDLPYCH
ncbi:hypothetical protein ABFG93_01755 [Pseudalkalibacillus hwajinpoensis]